MHNSRTHRFFIWFKKLNYIFLFITVGIFAPLELKEVSPRGWGYIEGKAKWDMTGFLFSPLGGNGDCRIKNSLEAFNRPGSRIIFGEMSPPDRRPYPHLWTEERGQIIDTVCPPGNPACTNRRVFAVIDPVKLVVEQETPLSNKDKRDIVWGMKYLAGLKAANGGV